MNQSQYRQKFFIKILLSIFTFLIFVFMIKAFKHSNFLKNIQQKNEQQTPVSNDTGSDNIAKNNPDEYSVSLSSFIFDNPTQTQQIGRMITLTDSNDNIYYSVNYPEIGIESIDVVLQNDVNYEVANFHNITSGYIAQNSSMRAGLSIDYQAYLTGDSLLSVIYNIVYDSPEYSNPISSVHTHTFMLCTGQEIQLSSILSGKYVDFLSKKTKQFLSANPDLQPHMNDSSYSDNHSAQEKNFSLYSFSNNGLTLYFNPYTIAPGEYGIVSFTIPADTILPYIIYNPFKEVTIPAPPVETAAPVVQAEIDPDKPMVALTFDDGPRRESTERILDVLEQYNCHATFFIVGSRAKKEKKSLKRAAELGCDIANHSYSHPRLNTLNSAGIKNQIRKTDDIIKKLTGRKVQFVRTPYGQGGRILKYINHPVILWNIDTLDWKTLNAKKIVKAATANVEDGDIILMHDIYNSTAEAVETIVPKLIEKGFQVVSVSELFKYKKIKPKKHKVYFNCN